MLQAASDQPQVYDLFLRTIDTSSMHTQPEELEKSLVLLARVSLQNNAARERERGAKFMIEL